MKLGQECPKTQGERHWTARAKERLRPARGEQHYAAKLTPTMVFVIRGSPWTHAALARWYNVSESTVRDCRNRRTWKHLP